MSHPYYPQDLFIPDYVPNLKSQLELFLIMGGVFVCLATVFYRLGKNSGSPLKFIWFMICGLLHCGFELYYALNVGHIASQNNLLAQLWKEYAKGDSRYVIYDPSLLALEIMTIVNLNNNFLKIMLTWFNRLSMDPFASSRLILFGLSQTNSISFSSLFPCAIC